MSTYKINGQLEVDHVRGVIYFHSGKDALRAGVMPTPLRFGHLPPFADLCQQPLDLVWPYGRTAHQPGLPKIPSEATIASLTFTAQGVLWSLHIRKEFGTSLLRAVGLCMNWEPENKEVHLVCESFTGTLRPVAQFSDRSAEVVSVGTFMWGGMSNDV